MMCLFLFICFLYITTYHQFLCFDDDDDDDDGRF